MRLFNCLVLRSQLLQPLLVASILYPRYRG